MDRDIVARLRDSQPEGTTGGYLLNDAADEIEELRGVLRQIVDESNKAMAMLGMPMLSLAWHEMANAELTTPNFVIGRSSAA